MSYQMMVLTHILEKKSYCTGSAQFLQAASREELIDIIRDPNAHGDPGATFNQEFRPLFLKNINEVSFILFEGENQDEVENAARAFADGRVCTDRTSAEGDKTRQCPPFSTLDPVRVSV